MASSRNVVWDKGSKASNYYTYFSCSPSYVWDVNKSIYVTDSKKLTSFCSLCNAEVSCPNKDHMKTHMVCNHKESRIWNDIPDIEKLRTKRQWEAAVITSKISLKDWNLIKEEKKKNLIDARNIIDTNTLQNHFEIIPKEKAAKDSFLVRKWVETIAMSNFSVNSTSSLGVKNLFMSMNNNQLPKGFSRSTVSLRISERFEEEFLSQKADLARIYADHAKQFQIKEGRNKAGNGEHDIWTKSFTGDGTLGLNFNITDISGIPWVKKEFYFGVNEHLSRHTADNTIIEIEKVYHSWDVDLRTMVNSITSDTTGSAINVAKKLGEFLGAMKCRAHLSHLAAQHGIEDDHIMKEIFVESLKPICTTIRSSFGRRVLLLREMTRLQLNERCLILPAMTRWGMYYNAMDRYLYCKQAVDNLNPSNMFPEGAAGKNKKIKWKSQTAVINSHMYLIKIIMPVYRKLASWTQLLSTNQHFNLSFVWAAYMDIKKAVEHAFVQVAGMETEVSAIMYESTKRVLENCSNHIEKYLGNSTLREGQALFATYLDPRLMLNMNINDFDNFTWAKLYLQNLGEGHEREVPNDNAPVAKRRRLNDDTADRIRQLSFNKSLIERELIEYENCVDDLYDSLKIAKEKGDEAAITSIMKQLNPVYFWPMTGCKIGNGRILERLAARIMSGSATSSNVERLFSNCGLICTSLRNKLSVKMLNRLVCLNKWLHQKYKIKDTEKKVDLNFEVFLEKNELTDNVSIKLVIPEVVLEVKDDIDDEIIALGLEIKAEIKAKVSSCVCDTVAGCRCEEVVLQEIISSNENYELEKEDME